MKTTKELARELGLLRKRSSSTSTVLRAQQTCLNAQQFKFLIVIDFESTCWEEEKFKTQEIIEFPAVLLNVVTGEVESVFHHYVQPQEHPSLSDFCTKLTGITQDQVEAGIPINLCLKKFNHWLDRLHREKGVVCPGTASPQPINTTCVTWSDWDLGVCLQYECKRKQLLKPSQLTSWIDLRATYRKFYDRKPNGLNGALQDLGIEFEGREHSGVDDAKNTAKLAYRMIQDGCILKITKTLKTHERSASSSAAITSYFRTQANGTPPNKKKTKFLSPTTKVKSKSALPNHYHCNMKKDIQAKCGSTPMKGNVPDSPRRKNNGFTSRYQANEISPGNNGGQYSVEQPALSAQWQMSKTAPTATNTNKNMSTSCTSTPCKSPGNASKSSPSRYTRGPGNQTQMASKISPAKHLGKVSCQISSPFSKNGTIQQKSTPKKIIASQTSNKRKQFTPLKDTTVRSPCRKVTRKISPKKLSVQDIYIDPGVSEALAMELTPGIVTSKGLKEQDSNIQANTELKNQNINNKPLPKNVELELPRSNAMTVQNKENIEKTNYGNRKSFTSSTPLHPQQKSFIQPKQVSPINPKYAGYASTNDSSQFKTPSHTCFSMTSSSSSASFKIPTKPLSKSATFDSSVNSSASNGSSMKMTPPLCKCGRRSKRRMVQSPGQNMGRFFFSCPVRPRVGAKEGCDFFKWEQSLEISERSARSSISSQFTPVVGGNIKSFRSLPNTQQKRSLGVRPVITNRTYMR